MNKHEWPHYFKPYPRETEVELSRHERSSILMAVSSLFENSKPLSPEKTEAVAYQNTLVHPNTTSFRFYAQLVFVNIVKTGPQTDP